MTRIDRGRTTGPQRSRPFLPWSPSHALVL